MKGVDTIPLMACLLKLLTVAVRVINDIGLLSYKACLAPRKCSGCMRVCEVLPGPPRLGFV